MSACEKCWADAGARALAQPTKSQAEHYRDVLWERRDAPCTPEEQRGERKEEPMPTDPTPTEEGR